MRKHGWQLPYHPLQIVAVAVFLALGFAFYVFFAPFVGGKLFQFIVIGIYTPLIASAFGLYICCAATDPADRGVFRSSKYLQNSDDVKTSIHKNAQSVCHSSSSIQEGNSATEELKSVAKNAEATLKRFDSEVGLRKELKRSSWFLLPFSPFASLCNCCTSNDHSSEHQMSEDGMFYCSLCEVEVFKYSKHCRVCDKCVDRFDHHCRWLNNCIGKGNYKMFFALMVSALLLLILQWATGVLVLICCFRDHKHFSAIIPSKLGSSFSLVPFIVVVGICTSLAMVATVPLAQLFFFHILLIKKGISTYDYIVALREQEQEQRGGAGQHSPQMSPLSSITGLSSASSLSAFHRAAWCTPPRLFLEDQFDVVPPESGSVSSIGKKSTSENVKKTLAPVKISPWTLARLNSEEVTKAAAEARKKSKILQPVVREEGIFRQGEGSFGNRRMASRPENSRKRSTKRIRLPGEIPMAEQDAKVSMNKGFLGTTSLAPLQLEARSAFQTSRAMSGAARAITSSPESSSGSPDIPPFRVSSFGVSESNRLAGIPLPGGSTSIHEPPLSRSTSDGYEASGGEDSDRVPSRIIPRSTNWSNHLFRSEQEDAIARLKAVASSSHSNF